MEEVNIRDNTIQLLDLRVDSKGATYTGFEQDIAEEMTEEERNEIDTLLNPVCEILEGVISRIVEKVSQDDEDVPWFN